MIVKDIVTVTNDYKKTGLLVAFPTCTFKCCEQYDFPIKVCQNSKLASQEDIQLSAAKIVEKYNPEIHHALIMGGLEPFDSAIDLMRLIAEFRKLYEDDVVIFTGYTESEVSVFTEYLSHSYKNIIIKFGRYNPNEKGVHFDKVLGVNLSTTNQYGKKIC